MRKIITLILLGLIFFSCTQKKEIDNKKKLFDLVIKDRFELDSGRYIIQESADTIDIINLTLIENTFNKMKFDTIQKGVIIFHEPGIVFGNHPFYKDSIDYYENQIKNLCISMLDTASLRLKIKVDSPLKELPDTLKYRTDIWIKRNIKNKAFLQISEPIYNSNGNAILSAVINTSNYTLFSSYVLKQDNKQWAIKDYYSRVFKYSDPVREETKDNNGVIHFTEKQYVIYLGTFDL